MSVNAYDYTPRVLQVQATTCERCGNRLYACNNVRQRPLQTLSGKWRLIIKDKVCKSPECELYGRRICPPEEAELPILDRRAYGTDVVAWIGEQRTKEARSEPEIHAALTEKFGLNISARHVGNLYEVFLALVHCVNADTAPLREKLIQQGKILLSVDGVQFDETSPVLYVLRDTISRRVLYSERVPNRSTEHLRALVRKVKEIGVPVVGVISDKEDALVTAVAEELPGVPHQHCQTHFLKNLVKPMQPDLATLGEATKDAVTAIRRLERQLPAMARSKGCTADELKTAQQLCQAARAGGKVSGDAILHPTPLKRFERLVEVEEAAELAVRSKRKDTSPLLMSVLGALVVLQAHVGLARRLGRQIEIVRRIAHVLQFMTSGQQIRRMLRAYLNQLKRKAPTRGRGAARGEFIQHVLALANRYWAGLFHCYDIEDMPRSNNALELLFSMLKRHERKVTGRKSTAGGLLETCAEFLLEAWDTIRGTPNLEELLGEVTDEQLQAAREKLEELSEPARIKRRIQRNPKKFLQEVLKAWRNA